MSNYENLKVWHKAVDLAVSIYKLTSENILLQKDFGLKDQMRRAAVSISSNISEGDELGTDKQAIRQFYIAKGSSQRLCVLCPCALRLAPSVLTPPIVASIS
jgi:four helix bundle protein